MSTAKARGHEVKYLKNVFAARLNPGYFAFVMATGIISIAAYRLGMEHIAKILFYINNVVYAVLIIFTFIYIALASWIITFGGLLYGIARLLRKT